MKTRFAFGKDGIEVTVPDRCECTVVHTRSAPGMKDAAQEIADALDNPIGSVPLAELAAGKRSAAISICDITRPAPNRVTLPPLLSRLHGAGIPQEGVTLLIATGLHRAATKEELDMILGPEIARTYRVVSHDARNLAAHRFLGTTRGGTTQRGTPVFIDQRFMAADLHLTLGFVEQHLMLGFSGGRKLIAPGLAAQETIKVLHSSPFMREPLATEGSIQGNPLHAELLEIAAMARHDFMVDVTLTREREISGVFAGDAVKAHAAAVEFLEETSLELLPRYADAAITSAAGFPLDLTFYQTVKGITAAQHLVRPGGKILVLGACAEGVGAAEFAEMLRGSKGPTEFLDEIRETPVRVDQWQMEKLMLAAQRNELLFYTPGVAREELGSFGASAFGSIDEAVAALMHGLGSDARVVLVPDGPYTYARALA